MSRDVHGHEPIPLHSRRQQQQEANTQIQLLIKLLSPTYPLGATEREDLAQILGQLLEQLHD